MSINGIFLSILLALSNSCYAQVDTASQSPNDIPLKYFTQVNSKIGRYAQRVNSKTEKTLTRLTRWEGKIKILLMKASPAAAAKLFAPGTLTFSSVLSKYKQSDIVTANAKVKYDAYSDQLTTSLKYLSDSRSNVDSSIIKDALATTTKINLLNERIAETETLQAFIKERKQKLLSEAVKVVSNSKYLQNINKETFYYTETLRNYKEIFKDKKKAEETAVALLNKIPAFKKFMSSNSMLASLFRTPGNSGASQSLVGLQTRASVNALIQDRIGAGRPNARETISQNMQAAQAEINKLKEKLIKAGATYSNAEMPDFKPNLQKTKTLKQRMEYGFDLQFSKNNSSLPASTNVGLSVGYKLNDKSVIGIGASYKLGMGKIDKIKLSNEGLGVRSFVDWKLKKQLFISGGFELNHFTSFKRIAGLKSLDNWQRSGLLGISKKINQQNKFLKGGKLQLLYDFLWNQHLPASKPFIFRMGYQL